MSHLQNGKNENKLESANILRSENIYACSLPRENRVYTHKGHWHPIAIPSEHQLINKT